MPKAKAKPDHMSEAEGTVLFTASGQTITLGHGSCFTITGEQMITFTMAGNIIVQDADGVPMTEIVRGVVLIPAKDAELARQKGWAVADQSMLTEVERKSGLVLVSRH